ncbi:MAG: metallophosphoesterase [Thermoplasmata archaeon]|jgi:putative SbcD/Mre11-related phosphoesterase
MIDFIFGRPAAYIKSLDAIVISDLHLGIERDFESRGVLVGRLETLENEIIDIIEENNAGNLIILGDVKHAIKPSYEEMNSIREFFSSISEHADITIIKGNHDGGIEKILNARVYGPRGARLGEFYFNHGHTWPGRDLDGARYLLMGHLHPEVNAVVPGTHRKFHRCWLIGHPEEDMREFYDFSGEVIIFPAFNPLVGMSVREYAPGPLFRNSLITIGNMDVYLLDSRHLGKFSDLSKKGKIYYQYYKY